MCSFWDTLAKNVQVSPPQPGLERQQAATPKCHWKFSFIGLIVLTPIVDLRVDRGQIYRNWNVSPKALLYTILLKILITSLKYHYNCTKMFTNNKTNVHKCYMTCGDTWQHMIGYIIQYWAFGETILGFGWDNSLSLWNKQLSLKFSKYILF